MPTTAAAPAANGSAALPGSSRLETLLRRLDKLLTERYAFDVFAKDSINFGDHGDLPADLGAAELPGGRPRLHHSARAQGGPPLHHAAR